MEYFAYIAWMIPVICRSKQVNSQPVEMPDCVLWLLIGAFSFTISTLIVSLFVRDW